MFLLFVDNNDENKHEINDHKRLKIFFFKFKTNINVEFCNYYFDQNRLKIIN